MQAWRIHVGWTIVTALAVAISARLASQRDGVDPPVALRPAGHSPGAPVPSAAEAQAAEAPPAVGADSPLPAPLLSPASTEADRIRAMLKTPNWAELQKLGHAPPDRRLLLQVLSDAMKGPDMQSVYSAIAVLRMMKGRDVAEILEAFLASHADDDTGANAAEALGEVGDQSSLVPLSEGLRSSSEEIRLSCAAALIKLGYSAPAEQIVAELARQFESPDGGLRKKAIEQISRLNPQGAIPLLARALKDSNGDVRQEAVWAFSNLHDPSYLPLLQPLVSDPNPEVARAAKEAVNGLTESDNQ